MSRHHIVTALAFVLVAGALGAAYQFYFKEKLEVYSKAKGEMTQLESRLKELNNEFQGFHPTVFVPAVKGAVRPFQEAAEQRALYFNMRDMWTEEEVPEDKVTMAKFYYGDKWNEKYQELMRAAYQKTQVPPDLFSSFFEVPNPEELADYPVPKEEVAEWLTKINFGSALVRMMIDAKAVQINQMYIWPSRNDVPFLDIRTIGLDFYMRAEDLTAFLDKLRTEPRYYTVDAIRIQNSNLLANYGSPYLQVEMLLSMARYLEEKSPGRTGVAAPSTGGLMAASNSMLGGGLFGQGLNTAPVPRKKKPWWSKLWPF